MITTFVRELRRALEPHQWRRHRDARGRFCECSEYHMCDFHIMESTRCVDCAVVCLPDPPARGFEMMIRDDVWTAAGLVHGWICLPCLSHRLGREVQPADLADNPLNIPSPGDDMALARLKAGWFAAGLARRRLTADDRALFAEALTDAGLNPAEWLPSTKERP